MIILDNTVLSAFTRLKLLSQLKNLISSAIISKGVLESNKYRKKIQHIYGVIEQSRFGIYEDLKLKITHFFFFK